MKYQLFILNSSFSFKKRITSFALLLALFCWCAGASIAKGPAPALSTDLQIATTELPKEAQQTIVLIRKGGPFPYDKDGVIFGNREKLLPKQPRGYYTEYTVKTPGAKNRGARRLVVGGEPQTSKEVYYTDDHYQSFKRVKQVDK